MALMSWNDKMSVGVKSIDDQHKKLVDMLNELFDGVQHGKTRETMEHVLDEMIAYTAQHFKYEEDLFAKTSYAGKDEHKKQHDDLTKQVLDVQSKFKAGISAGLSLEVMNFLKDWLNNHILGSDKKYTEHFISHGVA